MARRVKISFEGLNINRTVLALSQKYVLYNVVRKGRNCQITVDAKVFRQAVAFLKERCYNITNIQKIGWNSALSFVKTHFLLPIFATLAILALFFASNICWKVEVSGDYTSQEVFDALSYCDVGIGSSLFGFSADKLENRLCTQLNAMYAVVTRKGSALYINAVKRKSANTPIDMNSRRDILATASGKVVQLLCEQGTAAVEVGDFVQKGDVLIFGKRVFNDGTSTDVYALGKIVIQPSAEAFREFFGTIVETVETGNTFCANAVVLFGKSYGKLPPFESYRTKVTETKLSPLNLTIKHIVYCETREVTKSATIFDCLEELKLQALQLAMQNADFYVKSVSYRITDNGVYATVFGEIEVT